jgi:hypothetical protein
MVEKTKRIKQERNIGSKVIGVLLFLVEYKSLIIPRPIVERLPWPMPVKLHIMTILADKRVFV